MKIILESFSCEIPALPRWKIKTTKFQPVRNINITSWVYFLSMAHPENILSQQVGHKLA